VNGYGCRLPAGLSMGNAIIGTKTCRTLDVRETASNIEAAPAIA